MLCERERGLAGAAVEGSLRAPTRESSQLRHFVANELDCWILFLDKYLAVEKIFYAFISWIFMGFLLLVFELQSAG